MPETRPTGEQLRFVSERTGEHIVDTYLEAAERGNRTLADLMADIFDESGQRRGAAIQIRVNTTTRNLQFREGTFASPEAGWQDVPNGFVFRQRGAYANGQSYEQLDVVTQNDSIFFCTAAHTASTPTPGPNFQLMVNGGAVNAARTDAQTAAASASASQTAAATSATNAATSASAASTSASNASTSATNAAASASAAASSATAASNSATSASSSANSATTSANNASSSATSASTSASNASNSATLAQQFANAPVNTQVQTGLFSAYHWSEQARIFATGTLTYRGTWDASGGTLPASPANNDFYIIRVAGTVSSVAYNPGDQIIFRTATGWERVVTGQTVFSVAGKTGTVTLVIADIANLQTTLNGKTDVGHTHTIANVTGLQTALDGKSNTGHTHTIAEVTGLQAQLDGKAATAHTHVIADVTGLQTALNGKLDTTAYTAADVRTKLLTVDGATSGIDADLLDGQEGSFYRAYANLTGVPATFTPSAHTHTIAEVTGLQTALDGKQNTLGFTPVEQGGGAGQGANKIRLGWDGAATRLKVQVDSTDLGNVVFDSQLTWNNLSGRPTTFTPSAHSHVIADVTGLQAALDAKQNTLGFTPVQQTGATTIAIGWSGTRLTASQGGTSLGNIVFDGQLTWANISGRPSTFAPSAHTHDASDITSGVFAAGLIPNLDATRIISGVFDPARLGGGSASIGTVLTVGALGSREWRALGAGDIQSGTLPVARGGTGTTTSTGSGSVVLSAAPTLSGAVNISGSLTATGDITAFSDRRLKRLEGNFELTVDEMASVRPINYRMAEGGAASTGVFAQELEDILPRLVIKQGNGFLAVDYGKAGTVLALCLAQHVKVQQDKIKNLELRLMQLEALIGAPR